MSSLRQGLQQKLLQKLSPQQIQLMKLLQIPVANLEQRIKEELIENPALEEGNQKEEEYELKDEDHGDEETISNEDEDQLGEREDDISIEDYMTDDDVPDYKTASGNGSADEDKKEMPMVLKANFQEQLLAQLYQLDFDDKQYHIAAQLIGSIDDDGYLRRDLNSIIDDLLFSQNISTTLQELSTILSAIQSLDPPGIGAQNLQECLLLQLQRKDSSKPLVAQAIKMITHYMDEFSKKHYDKIIKGLSITEEELKPIIELILKLNPKPGSTANEGQRSAEHVIPDFLIYNNDGKLELTLNGRNAPELHVSREYKEMLDHYSKDKKNKANTQAITFVKQKLDAAKWFIDALKQRNHTLLETMRAIMQYQYDYFLDGDPRKLKKMVLRDIAEKINMDISTVSRVSNSKYVQTQFGTFLLKNLFSEGMETTSGEEVSSKEVKQILSDAIGEEDKRKPLTDDQLAKILHDKGYNIARRTVAKYREMLDIPVARLRKTL
jgi:RNA polymerase sigma-54 factor